MNVWDILIFLILGLDVVFIILVFHKGSQVLSEKIRDLIIISSLLFGGIIIYGSFIEPHLLSLNQRDIQLSDEWDKHTQIVAISDLHLGPYKKEEFMLEVVDTIKEINPHAVVIVGDYVYKNGDEIESLNPLKRISSTFPTYAVLGNHDYGLQTDNDKPDEKLATRIKEKLEELNIYVLENSNKELKNSDIVFAGVDDLWTKRSDVNSATESIGEDKTTILLSHNADIVSESPDVDLIISGHTHGGQIRLPLIGPVPPLPHKLGRGFDKGLFSFESSPLFITSGLGESGPRARLFNPPEVAILDIFY